MEQVECVVIGAGVVGLATARALAQAGREVLVLEQADSFGTATSSRNSEVLHAGIYYPPGSLRAELCIRGRAMLLDYMAARDVPHRLCGKLIVASDPEQEAGLRAIRANALAAGAGELDWLDAAEVRAREPELAVSAALYSPGTGIIDSHALMLALLADAEAAGALLVPRCTVSSLTASDQGIVVQADEMAILARSVVNAAGLGAVALAATLPGITGLPQAHFARGTWFGLPGRALFSHLVYPVPEPGGLGIHLTLDLGGGMRFGPDVEWISAVNYRLSDARAAHFAASIRRYWPGLPEGVLAPVSCGVRPKIHGPGQPAADFRIDGPAQHGIPGLVNLLGIESPGLTACMAIARTVVARLT